MGRNWAIVVGINHYDNLQSLKYAKRDASVMATWLQEEARFDQVFLFTDDSLPIATNPPIPTQPTYGHLRRFLRANFEQPLLAPGDNLWFFFSGHGCREGDRDYLILIDSDPGDVEHTAISVDYVTQRLCRSGADNVVLFLEASRDGSSRYRLGIGEQRYQEVITFYSCTANQKSWEIDELQHSSFTYSLLEGLRLHGEANCATVERLAQYLSYQVPATNTRYGKPVQNPYLQAEPSYKIYFILLEQTATLRDVEPLKYQAYQAENKGDLSLAKQLWVRVLAVSRVDGEAIEAIERIAIRQRGGFEPTITTYEPVTSSSGSRLVSAEVLAREQEENQQKLRQYQQAFSQAAEREYPINQTTRNELKRLQQSLQITNDEMTQIEQPILAKFDVENRNKLQENRRILLHKVRSKWLESFFTNNLQEKVFISLQLEQRLDVVEQPKGIDLRNSEQLKQILPSGAKVNDVYYQLDKGRTLLILGEPGVGKTTALLELAYELIQRAEQNINQPIPVIFKLSSWKKRGGVVSFFQNHTIANWLVQELQNQYQVSQSVGLAWVKNQQLLLLLDGLDEVRVNSQDDCVQALNKFTQEYSMVDMVVTSRIRDYETLKHRLKFQSAIYLSPLIPENESQPPAKEQESGTFAETTVIYGVLLTLSSQEVQLAGEIEATIYLGTTEISNENSYLLEIQQDAAIGNELNVILNAPGFQLNGDNTASLPLDPNTAQETQTNRFCLTALRPGNATITAEIYRGDTFEAKLETQIQVADIDEATFIPRPITTQPRPVPQPDFILRIQTIWNETNSTCKFQYQLRSFRFPSVFSGNNIYTSSSFSISWVEQVQGLLATTLENIFGSLPTEGKSRLISLGQYLFGQVFPTELQTDFRSLILQNSTFTLLILANQEAWIPWELLYDGQRFFAERFIIGRWLQELNNSRPYEFPVGTVNVAHYANVEQPQLWATLLEAPGAPPPQPLPAGVLHDSTEAIRGLHLIRYSQSSDADLRNAPVTLDNINHTEDIELQMRPAKLNLRRNRPFVTLSYVKTDTSELTALENTWASAFIRAGCSGFTGSLWAVEPAVEAAFISCFYNRLWAGASLSEAFYTSRQLARVAAPDSLDWLAYVLFGDPMARPYRPVPGDGYAIVEPIGREIDDPLPPGAIARFRVTLRRNPPVWHEDRVIEVAENLVFENLQVHIVTYGLQVIPDLPITMTLTAKGDYLGWFTLAVPNEITETSALVQVYFADGMRPIHSLNFSLKIENGREE
jgi:uncharacterized caspase-like protein/DNA replication protein DnaC